MALRLFLVLNEMFARTRCVSTVLLTATAKLLNQLDGAGFITGCRSNIKQSMRCTEQSVERMSCNLVQNNRPLTGHHGIIDKSPDVEGEKSPGMPGLKAERISHHCFTHNKAKTKREIGELIALNYSVLNFVN